MEDLLACRVCLATSVNLYDLYKYKLKNIFEIFSGIEVSPADNYPQYLCSYCCALLLKCESFRQRCRKSQELMKYAEMKSRLTTSQIHSIAVSNHTALPLSKSIPEATTITEIQIKTEPGPDILFFKEEIMSDISDDEPLANKVRKKEQFNGIELEVPPLGAGGDGAFNDYDGGINFEMNASKCETGFDAPTNDFEVKCLTQEEQVKEILERKNSYNYINSFYKCEFCYKGFIQDGTYKNHMLRHDPSHGNEMCSICKTRWPNLRSLKSHRIAAHERNYICKQCNHVSKSIHRAKEHLKWHTGHKFVCKICGATFSKSTSHLTHLRLQHPSKFCCEVCGESFLGDIGLNMHMKKSHRSEKVNLKPQIKCIVCEQYFKSKDALQHHTNSCENGVCGGNLSSCFQCGENLTTQDALRDHLKTHDVGVKCEECDRNFAHERSFSIHYQRVHLGIKLKHFKSKDKRKSVACVCEICGKKCVSNAGLVYHQRTHTGEKPYQCIECPKKFSLFQRLQIHLRTHTGERPFKCSNCPKAFKHKAALNRHDRVHSGAKPYQCGHCGKTFSQSNSMKLHVRTVHLKMPAPYRARRGNNDLDILENIILG